MNLPPRVGHTACRNDDRGRRSTQARFLRFHIFFSGPVQAWNLKKRSGFLPTRESICDVAHTGAVLLSSAPVMNAGVLETHSRTIPTLAQHNHDVVEPWTHYNGVTMLTPGLPRHRHSSHCHSLLTSSFNLTLSEGTYLKGGSEPTPTIQQFAPCHILSPPPGRNGDRCKRKSTIAFITS